MIKAVVIDGVKYIVEKGTIVQNKQRESPRKNLIGEEKEEQNLLKSKEYQQFQEYKSPAYKWLNQVMSLRHISFNDMRVLSRTFAKMGNIKIYREFYRRKKACWYWVSKNLNEIQEALLIHSLKLIIKDKDDPVFVTPPDKPKSNEIDFLIDTNGMSLINNISEDFFDFYMPPECH